MKRTEKRICNKCGEDPCTVAITYHESKSVEQDSRFRDRRCPCKEDLSPVWHQIPEKEIETNRQIKDERDELKSYVSKVQELFDPLKRML